MAIHKSIVRVVTAHPCHQFCFRDNPLTSEDLSFILFISVLGSSKHLEKVCLGCARSLIPKALQLCRIMQGELHVHRIDPLPVASRWDMPIENDYQERASGTQSTTSTTGLISLMSNFLVSSCCCAGEGVLRFVVLNHHSIRRTSVQCYNRKKQDSLLVRPRDQV